MNPTLKPDIVRYLLGEMAEPELSAVEERLMSDADFFAEVKALEDELIDSYLAGELSPEQEQSFRRSFLQTPQRRQQLEFARTLRRYFSDSEAAQPPARGNGRWRSTALWATAALLVACSVEGVFVWRYANDLRRTRNQIAQLNTELQDSAARLEQVKASSLASVLHIMPILPVTRGPGRSIRRDATAVVLELQLPASEPGESFNVEILDQSGKAITRIDNAQVSLVDNSRVVFVPLHTNLMPEGEFTLLLRSNAAGSPDTTPLRYSFRLVRP